MAKRLQGGRLFVLLSLFLVVFGVVLRAPVRAANPLLDLPNLATGNDAPGLADVSHPPLQVPIYLIQETSARPVAMPAATGNGPIRLWGNEASQTQGRILSYSVVGGSVTPGPQCVPFAALNGRGVAYDPTDGNLWYSEVSFPGFDGDGFVHKTTPPDSGGCSFVTQIPFGDGPGGTVQDDIGALDIDPNSGHIWAAGYAPMNVSNQLRSYFYLINRNSGKVIRNCYIPFRLGGVGNDTLAVAQLDGLPGSGEYLLTDAGQLNTFPNSIAVLDTRDCKQGALVTPVAEYSKNQMSGIDFESPGLLVSDLETLRNLGGPPFNTTTSYGPFGNSEDIEDISLCGIGGVIGGGMNCPY
jgi:hypothetical protein